MFLQVNRFSSSTVSPVQLFVQFNCLFNSTVSLAHLLQNPGHPAAGAVRLRERRPKAHGVRAGSVAMPAAVGPGRAVGRGKIATSTAATDFQAGDHAAARKACTKASHRSALSSVEMGK